MLQITTWTEFELLDHKQQEIILTLINMLDNKTPNPILKTMT